MKLSMFKFVKEITIQVCCFPVPFSRLPKWDLENGAKKKKKKKTGDTIEFFPKSHFKIFSVRKLNQIALEWLLLLKRRCLNMLNKA